LDGIAYAEICDERNIKLAIHEEGLTEEVKNFYNSITSGA